MRKPLHTRDIFAFGAQLDELVKRCQENQQGYIADLIRHCYEPLEKAATSLALGEAREAWRFESSEQSSTTSATDSEVKP